MDPADALSPSTDFPVFPVIRLSLLRQFLDGARRVSPVAQHALATGPSLPPRRSFSPRRSVATIHAAFAQRVRARPSDLEFSRPPTGSFALRPGDSLTIPRMALSIGFRSSVAFPPAIQATELLTFAPVGLSPTEHASFCWTRTLSFATP
jgi:hypothetical protein